MKIIVMTGGGTAGHVYPNLALKEYLKDEYIIHYIGGKGMEKDILSNENDIIYHQIDTVKLERKLSFKNFLIPFKLIRAVRQCKKLLKKIKPNVIFVDPPRRGLDRNTIDNILWLKPEKLIYISCNPATMVRDLKLLEAEYEIKEIQPVDMFPFTSHVECVAVLEVKKTIEK